MSIYYEPSHLDLQCLQIQLLLCLVLYELQQLARICHCENNQRCNEYDISHGVYESNILSSNRQINQRKYL